MVRVLQDDVTSCGIGNGLFQVPNGDILLNHDQLPGRLQGHNLPVVAIGKGGAVAITVLVVGEQPSCQAHRRSKDAGQHVLTSADAYVQIGPAGIDVAMKPVEQGIARGAASFSDKGLGRRPEQARPESEFHWFDLLW